MGRRLGGTEEQLARVLDQLSMIVFAIDTKGVFTLSVGRGLEALGLEPGEVVGRSVAEAYGHNPHIIGQFRRALAGEMFTVEVEEHDIWWQVHYAPLRDAEEKLVGAVGIAIDITTRKLAEDKVQRGFAFMDSLVENLPNMIFVKDARELRFIRFNRAGEELLGYRREDLIGKNDYDFFPPAEAEWFINKDRAVLEGGTLVDIPEEPIHTRSHGCRFLHTRKIPINDDQGRPLYLLGISEDITERKQAEEERSELLQKLKQLDELKARLIANVSHEFRTPLTLILGLSTHLARVLGAGPGAHDIAAIDRNARLLLNLVNDLLDIAKFDAGRLAPDYAAIDLSRLVRLSAGSFEVAAREAELAFIVDAPPSLPAEVDPDRVQRIISNLLANAFKFTPRGGSVRLALEAHDGHATIEVADSGPGIAPDERERIFERFAQGRSEGRTGGTGLGLAIVREFAELHGGEVSVAQAREGGALFTIWLPLAAPEGTAVHAPPAAMPRPAPPLQPRPKPTPPAMVAPPNDGRPLVLVVEDNPDMNRFLVEALARDYRVLSAFDGAEGLRLLSSSRPDLLLTDVMMPALSGEELLAAARARPELEGIPIIALTARSDYELRVRLLRSGAQDFITKPFSVEELRARVDNLVKIKRTRDVLQRALDTQRSDIQELARELALRRRDIEDALSAALVARQRAEAESRLKSDFLALVAHELRTPMTALVLRSQRLERAHLVDTHEVQKHVRGIAAATGRLHGLIESLLDYARTDVSVLAVRPASMDLRALAKEVLEELRPLAEQKQLALELRAPDDLPMLEGDTHWMRLILSNLVANAVKFTERGWVRVTLDAEDGAHRIVVEDTGPGIPDEMLERVFEPFVQVAALEKKHHPGVGLGLCLVKRLLDAIHGEVELTSKVGRGSRFLVTIPSQAQTEESIRS